VVALAERAEVGEVKRALKRMEEAWRTLAQEQEQLDNKRCIAAATAAGAADLGFAAEHALPDHVERFLFSEDRLTLVAARRREFASRRQIDFQEVTGLTDIDYAHSGRPPGTE
jgi:hypothetical protein